MVSCSSCDTRPTLGYARVITITDSPRGCVVSSTRSARAPTTYSDREPFHYSFAMLAALAEVVVPLGHAMGSKFDALALSGQVA